MGACTFTDFTPKTETITDAKQAFQSAVAEAQYMSGHGGYTGTIAEKRNFKMATYEARTLKEAYQLANDMIDSDKNPFEDKWGPAGCIQVKADPDEPQPKEGWLFFGWASS